MLHELENGNVQMIVPDHYVGAEAYKKVHHITDTLSDVEIAHPYIKCHEMVRQIKNLQIKYRGMNWSEDRVSQKIQRDMWSATKYTLRVAQILERRNLIQAAKRKTDWEPLIAAARRAGPQGGPNAYRPRVFGRRGRVC